MRKKGRERQTTEGERDRERQVFTHHFHSIFVGLSVRFDIARVRKPDPDKQDPHEYRGNPESQVNVVVLLHRHGKNLITKTITVLLKSYFCLLLH